MRRQIAVFVVAVLVLPQFISAQTLTPGSRVRVSYPDGGSRTGSVVALTADTLELRATGSGYSTRLPLVEVSQLEVSRGTKRHPRYAGVGALIGVTVGAVGGFAAGEDDCAKKWVCISRPGGALIGGAILGATGGVIGLIAGAIPSESWERVSVAQRRVSFVTPRESHGQGVGLRLEF